jgi:hypothetical protein
VIAVGLLATIAAALLSTTKPLGAVALEWEGGAALPDSGEVAIPGGGAMRIVDAEIRDSEENAAGYRLFRVSAVLEIDAGSAVGQARVNCRTDVPRRTIPAKTPNSRASYPRSSSGEDLRKQDVPEDVQVEFNSHGTEIATLELDDAFTSYVNGSGVVASWPPYKQALQEWQWGLPDGRPADQLDLGFASVWRTTTIASSKVTCTVATAGGEATATTAGSLPRA